MLLSRAGLGLAAAMLVSGCSLRDDAPGGDWPQHGRTANEDRFSPLDEINDRNVDRLGLAWYHDFDTNRGQEATPIVVGGVLYVSTAWSKVYAFAADTGELLWSFDPQVPGGAGYKACCDVVNRGVAVVGYRVFVGTIDGRLIALDSRTGKQLWATQTTDKAKPYTITGAPRVVKGLVVIGNGGAEYGVRGYVSAYRVTDGSLAWRFYTVPGNPAGKPDGAASDPVMQKAARTWAGRWFDYGGGGTVWDSIVYDQKLDRLYIGVGNGGPFDYQIRSAGRGDNLFLSSVVALDPQTGRYLWHYQEVPADAWDLTATQQMVLATLKIDGRDRDVIMQAPKNGLFYVIDRVTGKPISARPYTDVNWTTGLDPRTGRPRMNPNLYYDGHTAMVMPSGVGGHNWNPMSFSPDTGLVYIPIQRRMMGVFEQDKDFTHRPGGWNTGMDFTQPAMPTDTAAIAAIAAAQTGALVAWDPVAQKERWSIQQPYQRNGGTLATHGNLVFQGTADGKFSAFRATDGKLLWTYKSGVGIMAGPVSYTVKGTQYVAVLAGFGGSTITTAYQFPQKRPLPGRLLVFNLDGRAEAPLPPPELPATVAPVTLTETSQTVERGRKAFHRNCMVCHGVGAIGGVLPDLRRSPVVADPKAFDSVVVDGALTDRGMVSFKDKLGLGDVPAIRAYLLSRRNDLAREGAAGDNSVSRAKQASH